MTNKRKKGDLVLKELFGKRKARRGFFGNIAYKVGTFFKQLRPIYSIGIVIVAVFILQFIIPQDILWPWKWSHAAGSSGTFKQESWAGGSGQGSTNQSTTDKFDTSDGRISTADSFDGEAGFSAYQNKSTAASGNSVANPVIAQDKNGNTLSVWLDSRQNGQHLYARLSDSQGRKLPLKNGGDTIIDGYDQDSDKTYKFDPPSLVYDPIADQFLVVWAEREIVTSGGDVAEKEFNVFLKRIKWDGDSLNTDYQLSIAGDDLVIQRRPQIAAQYKLGASGVEGIDNNYFVVTWQEQSYNDENTPALEAFFKVMARGVKTNTKGKVALSGSITPLQITPIYTQKQVTKAITSGHNGSFLPKVAIASNGKVLISWLDDRVKAGDLNNQVYGRMYDRTEFIQ